MSELTHKERTRARILDEAAKAMRAQGSEGIGVAALMKRAGLTHGGFYAHFENRDDLVAHAVARMFEDSDRMLSRTLGNEDAAEGLAALIDYYLSDRARAHVEQGCPLPALSGEAGRMPPAARERFGQGAARFRAAIEHALTTLGADQPASLAASVLAEMVGAMALARAVQDGAQAADILRASREQIRRRVGLPAEGS
jgi:TetR/AcrR family transcriptional repressor of nem operon